MIFFDEYLTAEAVTLIKKNKSTNLSFVDGYKKVFSFKNFKTPKKLIKNIYNRNMTIDKTEIKQNEFAKNLDKLTAYPARGSKYTDLKERCL